VTFHKSKLTAAGSPVAACHSYDSLCVFVPDCVGSKWGQAVHFEDGVMDGVAICIEAL